MSRDFVFSVHDATLSATSVKQQGERSCCTDVSEIMSTQQTLLPFDVNPAWGHGGHKGHDGLGLD